MFCTQFLVPFLNSYDPKVGITSKDVFLSGRDSSFKHKQIQVYFVATFLFRHIS